MHDRTKQKISPKESPVKIIDYSKKKTPQSINSTNTTEKITLNAMTPQTKKELELFFSEELYD